MPRRALPLMLALLAFGCGADPAPPAPAGFPASGVAWQGHFGRAPGRPPLCLMGSGFFREPRAEDLDATVTEWLSAHPAARAIVLAAAPPTAPIDFVWVRDGDEALNVLLVERGACPGGVMTVDPEWLVVPKEEYEALLDQVRAAEWRALEAGAGIWGMEVHEGERHLTLAGHLEKRERYLEAAAEYREAIPLTGSDRSTWFRIGECLERAGDHAGALVAYDEAIESNPWAVTHVRKAEFLERTEGLESAVRWLAGLERASPSTPEPRYWTGVFHQRAGRPEMAALSLDLAVLLAGARIGARFGPDGQMLLPAGQEVEPADLAVLADSLCRLARARARLRRDQEALRSATRGLAVVARMGARRRSEFSATEPDPDVGCHLVRAGVLRRAGDEAGARREIAAARAVAEADGNGSRGNRDAIAATLAEMEPDGR